MTTSTTATRSRAIPFACAVALKNLEIMERDRLVPKVKETTGPALAKLFARFKDHPLVGEVRTVGMLGAIELVADKKTRTPLRRSGPRRPHLPRSLLPRRLHHARRLRHDGVRAATDLDRSANSKKPVPSSRRHSIRRSQTSGENSRHEPADYRHSLQHRNVGGLTSDAVGAEICGRGRRKVASASRSWCRWGTGLADIASVLDVASGILLTGAISNVHPEHYSDEEPVLPHAIDRDRDAVTLPLIRAAVESKLPLFAICRGFQELNVALGGTLHQAVHTLEDYADHREPEVKDFDVMFAARASRYARGRTQEVARPGPDHRQFAARPGHQASSPSRSSPKRSPRMGWSKPCVRLPDIHFRSACSGIPSGRFIQIRNPWRCSAASATLREARSQKDRPHDTTLSSASTKRAHFSTPIRPSPGSTSSCST